MIDFRHAVRGLVRNRGLTLFAAAALALGIGATTTLFSIVHGATRGLPFAQADELVLITRTHPERGWINRGGTAFDYVTWSRDLRSFELLGAFEARALNVAGPERAPERVSGALITPGAFALLGAKPAIGRSFNAADAAHGAPATVLIGHAFWQARFDGTQDILGRTIRVNGEPRTIIGVMPEGFAFPVNQSIWLPLGLSETAVAEGDWYTVFGRLREGTTLEQAQGELTTEAARMASAFPATHASQGIRAAPLVEMEMDPEVRPVLYIMLLAISFVLLIACANVANLLLARAATRSRETAIRNALGASRSRIITQHLLESVLIALLGGLGGLAIAYVAVRFFDAATASILEAFWLEFRLDKTVLAFATLLIGAAGVLAGLLPALRASSVPAAAVLKESTASGLRLGRFSRALVVAELALAGGLMIVSGILVRSAISLRAVDFPFPENRIFTGQLGLSEETTTDASRRARFVRELLERVQSIPGVHATALTSVLPARGAGNWTFSVDGRPYDRVQDQPSTGVALITPGFLEVLDARVLRGRAIEWSDDDDAHRIALVNQSWVRRFSADRDPIGRTITLTGQAPATIAGVLPDLHMQDPGDARADGVYVSLLQMQPFSVRLLARTSRDPLAITPQVRARIAEVERDLPLFEIATLRSAIYADASVLNAFGTLFGVFGVGALFLTMVGLYGVVAFSVTQRTREIGIRMSLGATRRSILGLVLRSGSRPLFLGGLLGLLISLGIGKALAASGEEVLEPDARVFVGVFGALALTALIALLLPAARAARLDPQRALRVE